jgi:hypothetical protein
MLIYKGKGNFWAGIPARDLDDEEVKALGGEEKILLTGDYIRPKSKDEPAPKDKSAKFAKE